MVNFGYEIVRKLDFYRLRSLCIENKWFTKGNNDEYAALLNMTSTENITVDTITKMAQLIYDHSDFDEAAYSPSEIYLNICQLILVNCYEHIQEK